MYPFVETVRIEDGMMQNISYHQQRMERTMKRFFPDTRVPSLVEVLNGRQWPVGKIWKVHIEYDGGGISCIRADEYHIRNIRRLRLVTCNDIDYEYKSADRQQLEALRAMKGDADEVVIVRDGLITDTSYSNIALFDGHRWVTPRHPLLRGTMRQSLLDAGLLEERDVRATEWNSYEKVSLINAMMPLGRLICSTD